MPKEAKVFLLSVFYDGFESQKMMSAAEVSGAGRRRLRDFVTLAHQESGGFRRSGALKK